MREDNQQEMLSVVGILPVQLRVLVMGIGINSMYMVDPTHIFRDLSFLVLATSRWDLDAILRGSFARRTVALSQQQRAACWFGNPSSIRRTFSRLDSINLGTRNRHAIQTYRVIHAHGLEGLVFLNHEAHKIANSMPPRLEGCFGFYTVIIIPHNGCVFAITIVINGTGSIVMLACFAVILFIVQIRSDQIRSIQSSWIE